MNDIKSETEKELEARRNTLKKKIKKIRMLADRKTKIIQNKINIVRNEMSKSLVDATRNGDAKTCKDAWATEQKMKDYCDKNIIDDYSRNLECKIKDNFCFMCCDHEFGKANLEGKEQCYNICLENVKLRGDWKQKVEKGKKWRTRVVKHPEKKKINIYWWVF